MKQYTLAEQTRGLMALVACAGSVTAAARALEQQGCPIPAATLRSWMQTRRDEYDELREHHAQQLEDEAKRQLRETMVLAGAVQRKAIELAEERLDQRKDIAPAQTAAALAKVAASAADKLLALTGRPTQITEHRTLEEIVRPLVASGVLELPPGEDRG